MFKITNFLIFFCFYSLLFESFNIFAYYFAFNFCLLAQFFIEKDLQTQQKLEKSRIAELTTILKELKLPCGGVKKHLQTKITSHFVGELAKFHKGLIDENEIKKLFDLLDIMHRQRWNLPPRTNASFQTPSLSYSLSVSNPNSQSIRYDDQYILPPHFINR